MVELCWLMCYALHMVKLNQHQAYKIKQLAQTGIYSQAEIADMMGCSRTLVARVANGRGGYADLSIPTPYDYCRVHACLNAPSETESGFVEKQLCDAHNDMMDAAGICRMSDLFLIDNIRTIISNLTDEQSIAFQRVIAYAGFS